MSVVVYEGAVAPEPYVLDVTPGTSGVDLSTVSAAEFRVRTTRDEVVTWTAVMSNQSASTLTLTHTFATDDVPIPGRYVAYARLTIPGGLVRTAPREITVKGEFQP